jgi:hypothetical protein
VHVRARSFRCVNVCFWRPYIRAVCPPALSPPAAHRSASAAGWPRSRAVSSPTTTPPSAPRPAPRPAPRTPPVPRPPQRRRTHLRSPHRPRRPLTHRLPPELVALGAPSGTAPRTGPLRSPSHGTPWRRKLQPFGRSCVPCGKCSPRLLPTTGPSLRRNGPFRSAQRRPQPHGRPVHPPRWPRLLPLLSMPSMKMH